MLQENNVSVVIPTRNRVDSLNRVLDSLYTQSLLPKEIFIIDSSDKKIMLDDINKPCNNIKLIIKHTQPSVCTQRNLGIKLSTSPYVLLSDDDMVYEQEYISVLLNHLKKDGTTQVVSGLIVEKDKNDQWRFGSDISPTGLLYNWFFGLSVIADLSQKKYNNPFLSMIKQRVLRQGNRISKAGWPMFVDYSNDEIEFPFFSLMGAMIKKTSNQLFDPVFIYNGIGDNYDACIKLGFKIKMIKKTKAYHHKENINRIKSKKAFFYRTSALHYIMLNNDRFSWINQCYLIWSLLGVFALNLIKLDFEMVKYCTQIIWRILIKKNIYESY